MRDWQGSKRHPACVAVTRITDGKRKVIRATDFDEAEYELIGDGTVEGYDPTESAEQAAAKKADKATEKAEAEQVEAARPRRGRPPGSTKKN